MGHHNHNHNHHSHSSSHSSGRVNGNNLLLAMFLNLFITLVEIGGGILSNSFALISDAVHNLGDTVAIFLAYISNRVSKRPATNKHTFGHKRIEILAALINSIAMIAICIYLFVVAFHRIYHPETINGVLMVFIASIGLLANIVAMALLQKDKNKNLNIKAAYLHLLGDTLSSVIVIVGGIFIYFFKIYWLDPLLTFIIGAYVLKEAIGILYEAYLILIHATPENIDIEQIKQDIENMPGIENIHHVHAWQLNDTQIHFECHIDLKDDIRISQTESILFKIKELLKSKYTIEHTTVQFEFNCCDDKAVIREV